jgi:peptidoglycan-associated lipoprotein
MKRSLIFSAITLLFAATACAQHSPKVEIFAGYSYLDANYKVNTTLGSGSGGESFNGGSASGSYNYKPWFGAVADFGGYNLHENYGSETLYTYMFGPKFALRQGRVTTYVQALVGVGHISTTNNINGTLEPYYSKNGLAAAAGGGMDLRLTHRLAVRVVQVEYMRVQFSNLNSIVLNLHLNCARFSTGIVFRF